MQQELDCDSALKKQTAVDGLGVIHIIHCSNSDAGSSSLHQTSILHCIMSAAYLFRRLSILAVASGSLFLCGCANRVIGPEHTSLTEKPAAVCILSNPRVTYRPVLGWMRDAFEKRGVKTFVADIPSACPKEAGEPPYMVTWEARRRWDVVRYLGSFSAELLRDGAALAKSEYKASRFTWTKWANPSGRVDLTIEALLKY